MAEAIFGSESLKNRRPWIELARALNGRQRLDAEYHVRFRNSRVRERVRRVGLKCALERRNGVTPVVCRAACEVDDPEFVMLSPMMWTAWGQCGAAN